jgi:hypothetical protein
VKSLQDKINNFESNNKNLKNQLRAAKHQATVQASSNTSNKTAEKVDIKEKSVVTESSPAKSQHKV